MYCVDLAPVQFVGKGGISYVCTGDLPLGVRGGFVCIAHVKMYSTHTLALFFASILPCTEASTWGFSGTTFIKVCLLLSVR